MQWLNQFFEWIVSWFPHIDLMRVDHRGVKFKPGGKTELIEPGLYMWWPVTTDIEEIPIKRRAISVTLRLTTKDGYTVLIEAVIVFRVNDTMKAIVETYDFDDTIEEMAQKAAKPVVMSRKFDDVMKICADESIDRLLRQGCRDNLKRFGVLVEDAFVSDFSETRVFCHEGSGMAIAIEEDDDEE
jgi:regulator of protease activity HflC (stomatin/prohibitin superfamily)